MEILRIAYLEDGRQVEVLAEANEEGRPFYLVRPIYRGDRIAERYGDPFMTKKIYESPPKALYDSHTEAFLERIEGLQKERDALIEERNRLTKDVRDLRERYGHVHGVELLLDFLDGKITHLAYPGLYNPKIVEWPAHQTEDRKLSDGVNLVYLTGDRSKRLQFHVNQYQDGSGESEVIVPCRSVEEARKVIYDDMMKEWNKHKKSVASAIRMDRFATLGIAIPEEIRASVIDMQKKIMQEDIIKYRAIVADIEQRLRELTGDVEE